MRPLGLAGGIAGILASVATAASAAEPPTTKPAPSYDVAPYGGSTLGGRNGGPKPGAVVEVGPAVKSDKVAAQLKDIGVRDGADFGDKGRWYLFAAGSGRAVGLNVQRDPEGLLRNYGWSSDPAAAVGDIQAGVGFRKGPAQTSLGYVHRQFRPANAMQNIDFDNKDDMVALTFAIKPGR
jgi:hypothetical protein